MRFKFLGGHHVRRVLAIVGIGILMQACSATTGTSSPIAMGARTAPPIGVHAFCAAGGEGCEAPATIRLTSAGNSAPAGTTDGPMRFNVLPYDRVGLAGGARLDLARFAPVPLRAPAPVLNIAPFSEPDAPARVEVSPDWMPRIAAVNREINHRIEWRPDIDVYGVQEHWAMPLRNGGPRVGDCEDFVLEKRQRLLDMGIPAGALAIATGYSEATGHHAVLIVRTAAGDFVLDNTTPWVLPWTETAYRWLRIQEGESLLSWREVDTASLGP